MNITTIQSVKNQLWACPTLLQPLGYYKLKKQNPVIHVQCSQREPLKIEKPKWDMLQVSISLLNLPIDFFFFKH